MRYLDVDLNSLCWSKLDYSNDGGVSGIVLLGRPLVFDNLSEKLEFVEKYPDYVMYNVDTETKAVICYAEECRQVSVGLEMRKLIMYNLMLLNMALNSSLTFSNVDECGVESARIFGGCDKL